MNLDTLLADPALDLPVPLDGLARVDRRARAMRRRRRTLAFLPVLGVLAAVPLLLSGGGDSKTELSAAPPALSPKTQAQTFCPDPRDMQLIDVEGPTGNPVTNCQYYWRSLSKQTPPAMLAYQDQYSKVVVYPVGAERPSGLTPLPPGEVQDPELIVLDEYLGDRLNGLESACLTKAQAVAKAEGIVKRLGFENWPVQEHEPLPGVSYPSPSPEDNNCWGGAVAPRDHSIRLSGSPDPSTGSIPAYNQLIAVLRLAYHGSCWDRATALQQVHKAIADSSFPADAKAGFEVLALDAPVKCTNVTVTGGGNVIFTLRGPSGS